MRMSELWADMQHSNLPPEKDIKRMGDTFLRDQFAMMAIQGCVGKLPYDYEKRDEFIKNLAVGAYMIADAMMEERQWLPEKRDE